jgi:hypothetical protein
MHNFFNIRKDGVSRHQNMSEQKLLECDMVCVVHNTWLVNDDIEHDAWHVQHQDMLGEFKNKAQKNSLTQQIRSWDGR